VGRFRFPGTVRSGGAFLGVSAHRRRLRAMIRASEYDASGFRARRVLVAFSALADAAEPWRKWLRERRTLGSRLQTDWNSGSAFWCVIRAKTGEEPKVSYHAVNTGCNGMFASSSRNAKNGFVNRRSLFKSDNWLQFAIHRLPPFKSLKTRQKDSVGPTPACQVSTRRSGSGQNPGLSAWISARGSAIVPSSAVSLSSETFTVRPVLSAVAQNSCGVRSGFASQASA